MKTISVINLKGGVAKTTTSINLSTLLGDRWGRRVLLIDNDKQGNTSQFFGKYIKDATCGSARILQGEEPVIFTTNHGIDLINANMSLETAENKLLKSNERQDVKLKQFLEGKANQYDFCIIDNVLHVNLSFLLLIGWFTLAMLLVNEARSILENLVECGYNIPDFLIKGLAVTQKMLNNKAEIPDANDEEK